MSEYIIDPLGTAALKRCSELQLKIKELEAKNGELEKKLEIAVEALEDFVLEDDHLPACVYKNGFGYAYECKCMDRNYYNKDAVMIRARQALAAIKTGDK